MLDLAYQFRKIETPGPVEVHRESDNGNGVLVRSCAVVFPGNDLVGDLADGHVIEGEATAGSTVFRARLAKRSDTQNRRQSFTGSAPDAVCSKEPAEAGPYR